MERKQSIVLAGIVTGALLVASAGFALSSGALAGSAGDGAGSLNPVVATTTLVPAAVVPSPTTGVLRPTPTSVPVRSDDHGGGEGRGEDD